MRLKIGVDLAGLGLPVKKALQAASQWGVEAVEIHARGELAPREVSQSGRRHLRKILEDLGLAVSAVAIHTRRGYDDPEELERRIETTQDALRLAFDLRAPMVINRVGRAPNIAGPEGRLESRSALFVPVSPTDRLLVAVLTDLGRYGDRVGTKLAAETGSESGEDLAHLLALLPPGAIGVDLSPGDLVMAGHSPLKAIHLLGSSILHVHATDGIREDDGTNRLTALGQGNADFPAIISAINEQNYTGCFTVRRYGLRDPLAQFRKGVEYLGSGEWSRE